MVENNHSMNDDGIGASDISPQKGGALRRLFALSDPHLSSAHPKPMDVFGPHWENHAEKLADNWRATVTDNDVVLVPGDISWAMKLDQAIPDLELLANLPGEKILIKGNHDYWWSSLGKVKKLALPKMHFIQNNHVELDVLVAGGSRMWDFPDVFWPFAGSATQLADAVAGTESVVKNKGHHDLDPDKIRSRELDRLEQSLTGLPADARLRVAMVHFPPVNADGTPGQVAKLIGKHNIDICVFGHVHGPYQGGPRPGEDITIGKTRYVLASSDFLTHCPKYLTTP